MYLKEFHSRNWRNLQEQTLSFGQGMHCIYGRNGQGKSNFLEGIAYLLHCKSFRTHKLQELGSFGSKGFLVEGVLKKNQEEVVLKNWVEGNLQQKWVNGKKRETLAYLGESGTALVFTADSKRLGEGGPEERRKFFDRHFSLLDQEYLVHFVRFRQMLTHMKKALHSGSCSQRLWFSLKKTAWPSVQHLAEKREIWSEKIGELSRKIYREVFHAKEGFSLNYSGNLPGLESRFWQSSEREMEQRRMLVGPHLDDFSFLFGEHQLKQVGSSGQIRSGVLSVMMAVMVLMRERNGSWPLWLMDDFDSELDTQRLGNVLHWVGDKGQVFLTSAADYAKIKVLWKELGLNENAIATFHCQDGSIRH